ncbi:MAG: hypothetical protein VKJ64_07250 [Leptolyngbyaceae bacterium]|nr:hypothetical protein [Leptolyngbyaceae bacterium]
MGLLWAGPGAIAILPDTYFCHATTQLTHPIPDIRDRKLVTVMGVPWASSRLLAINDQYGIAMACGLHTPSRWKNNFLNAR